MNFFLLELFSFLLIPWYLYCTAWIGRELFALSGMTFWEFVQKGEGRVPTATSSRHSRSRRNRAVLSVLMETSRDQEETLRLFKRYCYSTLPAFLAFLPSLIPGLWGNWWISLAWNVVLFLVGLVIKAQGKGYREKHHLDPLQEEKLEDRQRRQNKPFLTGKSLVVYGLVGVFFLGMFVLIASGGGQIFRAQPTQSLGVDPPTMNDVDTMLYAMGFDTEDVSTSYWMYEESKLEQQVAGTTRDERFEFYVYSDDDGSLGAYNAICYDLTRDLEPDQRDAYEEPLPFGGEGFTYTKDGMTYYVLCWENTVVYAYAPEGGVRIGNMLEGLEYFEH